MAQTQEKKKSNSTVVTIVLIVIIIAVIYFLMNREQRQPKPMASTLAAPASGSPATTLISVNDNTVLKKGMNNDHVGKLQKLINKVNVAYGLPTITVDNSFGSGTESALKKLTSKTEISYADAEKMAAAKFKAQGYPDDMIGGFLSTISFGLFS